MELTPPAGLAAYADDTAARCEPRDLARAAEALSKAYRDGGDSRRAMRTAEGRAAYLQTRLPATWAAARAAFTAAAEALPRFQPSSMLDLCCGPGTAAWAATEVWPSLDLVNGFDRDRELLDHAREAARHAEHPSLARATWRAADVERELPPAEADLVSVCYGLNELDPRRRGAFLRAAWERTLGALVLVEPGTPEGFANILAARRALLRDGAQVAAPCPHGGDCPLEDSGEWCHFAQRVRRSRRTRDLKGGSLAYEDEKFSYLVATRLPVEPRPARILSAPRESKVEARLDLCTPEGGREALTVPRASERFREARKTEWGGVWPREAAAEEPTP
ncbi:MAG: small ribosomal subunit Rsm22 family protein [Candidatus Sumerlaeia bacterium]|nr:small ribosomal subunit Rsm22 family protein [Candidatus Sumerlaeia bacterium]